MHELTAQFLIPVMIKYWGTACINNRLLTKHNVIFSREKIKQLKQNLGAEVSPTSKDVCIVLSKISPDSVQI